MNDNTPVIVFGFILFAFVLFMLFMYGRSLGQFHEHDRIYNTCLELNADMKHSDVTVLCKKIVQ